MQCTQKQANSSMIWIATKLFRLKYKVAECFVVWTHRMMYHLHIDKPKKDDVNFLKGTGAARLLYLHEKK